MDRTRLQFDFDLQRMSIISFATRLWDIPVIKKQIRNYYSKRNRCHDMDWSDISKNVLRYLNMMGLPMCILIQLERIIFFIGQKIQDWIEYVINVLKLDFIFAENIHWTSFGTVNEIKIFDLYWRKIMNVTNFKTDSRFFRLGLSPLYSLACIFGHKEFINDHKIEMIDDIGIFYHRPTVDEVYNIMSTSILLTLRKDVTYYIEEPEELFKLCLKSGFCNAAKFYIETLNDINKVLGVLVEACVSCHNDAFSRGKCWDVLMSAVDKMTKEENAVFLGKFGKKIIKDILFFWPYQEWAVNLLDYDWEIESSKLRRLLNFVVDFQSRYGGDFEYLLDNKLHFQILEKVWEKMPVAEKVLFVEEDGILLFSSFDISFLNLILNDEAIKKNKTGVLEKATKIGCRVLAESGKFEKIDKFIENVLNSNQKPKENLKKNHSRIIDFFLKTNNFEKADRFLDWISDSDEERAKFKKSVNIVRAVTSLTEVCFEFALADKVLKWKFETDAEIKNFKEGMKSHNFIRAGKKNDDTSHWMPEMREIFGEYLKIKSGTLSDLKPGDIVAMKTDDFTNGNSGEGFLFYKYDPAREIMTGDILGIKSNDCAAREEIRSRRGQDSVSLYNVNFVGTKPGDYVLQNVYKIWGKSDISLDPYEAPPKRRVVANGFIKFYYETEEEVEQFKKIAFRDVHSDIFAGNLYENFFIYSSSYHYQQYDVEKRFFKFFNMSSDVVKAFKIQLRNNIEKIMDVYLVDRCNVWLADFYFRWLFGYSDEKLENIKKFVNSSDRAILLCISYLRTRDGCLRNMTLDRVEKLAISPLRDEIFNYLRLIGDVQKLKIDSRVLNENPPDWFFSRLEHYRKDFKV